MVISFKEAEDKFVVKKVMTPNSNIGVKLLIQIIFY